MSIYAKPLTNQTLLEKNNKTFHNNKMLNDFYYALSISKLIQEAERLKFTKQFNQAAKVLNIAQKKMYLNKEKRLEYLLKYPMYLQLCGKIYSGWMEFYTIKKLLFNYEKENIISLSELLYCESKISTVMSIFQERQKEYASSIFFTIRSYIEVLLSLYHIIKKQKDKSINTKDEKLKNSYEKLIKQGMYYLKLKKASFQIVSMLATTLHRLDLLFLLKKYFKLTKQTIKNIPTIDYIILEEKVKEIYLSIKI